MFQKKGQQENPGANIRPNRNVKLPFPKMSYPKQIGFFSIVGGQERKYEPSLSQLHYLNLPKKFPLNLNEGLSLAVKKPETVHNEKLDNLLKFIFDERKRLFCAQERATLFGAEVVCWRGLLRLIMCTPYEYRQDWCIHVIRYRGTFYIYQKETEYDKQERENRTEKYMAMQSWGFKFEQYCLADSPKGIPNTDVPVDECSEFTCVFRRQIGGLNVLYGAEMDGVISEQPVTPTNNTLDKYKFIELKVRQKELNQRQEHNFKLHVSRKWWCQSFLVGINDIYVGLRNEDGLVQQIDLFNVCQLPRDTNLHKYWSSAVCANFLEKFLKELTRLMAHINCPYTTYEFYFNSQKSCITYECFLGVNEHSFLPDWFVKLLDQPNPGSQKMEQRFK